MKRLFWGFIFSMLHLSASAIIAYPYPVRVKTANGFTYITIKGNENGKYAVTSDGYCIVQDSLGWRYLKTDAQGNISVSDFFLEDTEYYSGQLNTFLTSESSVRQLTFNQPAVKRQSVRNTQKAHRQDTPVTGHRKALIVMMQFTDCAFKKSHNEFDALFNEHGHSADGAAGSVYDYYQYASYGQLDLQCDVIGPFTASHDMAYYGKNVGMGGYDQNPYALFTEALQHVASTVSLSDYDADGDGFVDNFHIIYAGYGEEAGASSNAIWAHESTFNPVDIDGMKIDRYSCAPELRSNRGDGISRIGPHCHEIGHALGAMDYYDTDYATGGSYLGTGQWDVMASGSWNNEGITPANFNPYIKAYDFGWMNIVTLTADTAVVAHPSCTGNTVYRIDTPVKNDFFLVENRRKESFDMNVPGEGLLIFHICPDIDNQAATNSINATYPQNCYIVCASSTVASPNSSATSYGQINSDGCPFPGSSGKSAFTPVTTPAAICQNGKSGNFSITEIQENSDGSVSFCFIAGDEEIEDEPEIPTDGEIVWEEDFKDWTLPQGWSQAYNIGNASWARRMSAKDRIFYFMELTHEASPFEHEQQAISTSLLTPPLDLESSDYVLSYDVSSISQNTDADTLRIALDNGEVLAENILINNTWETKNIIIPRQAITYRIVFEGAVQKASALRLTNIKLRKPSTTDLTGRRYNDSNEPCAVYNILGQKAGKRTRGLKILRMPDGTCVKVVIK